MLFSILIPVYNVEEYLDECLRSIIKQTEQDYEIILVNDGSTDSSGKICELYKDRYPDKITLIHQKNKGQFLTRRAAIKFAKGEYYIFVDSDDYLRSDALHIFREIIEKYEVDLILFNYAKMINGNIVETKGTFSNKTIFKQSEFLELHKKILQSSELNNLWTKVVYNKLVDKNNDYLDIPDYVNMAEDLLQSLPIFLNCKRALYLDKCLYFYRYNSESITSKFNPYFYESVKYVRSEVEKQSNLFEIPEKEKQKLIGEQKLDLVYKSIIELSKKDCTWNTRKKKVYLKKIAEDLFFINPYDEFGIKNFKNKQKISLYLLRKQHLTILCFLIILQHQKRYF